MDGTLCDFDGAMEAALLRIAAPGEIHVFVEKGGPDWLKERRRLIKSQPGFWRNLRQHEPGFLVYYLLLEQGFQVHILTKGPHRTTSAWTEKVEWCHEHVPEASVNVVTDKGLFYGKVLVDDWPPYVERWLEWRPRGLVIMPAQPWNAGFSHPNVVRFEGTNWEEVKTRIGDVVLTTAGARG